MSQYYIGSYKSLLRTSYALFWVLVVPLCDVFAQEQPDSLLTAMEPVTLNSQKRTVRPGIYYNHYGTPARDDVRKRKKYSYAQDNIGFFMPVYTHYWFKKDQVSIASVHVLAVADIVSYRPDLTFLHESFRIARFSPGGRLFYNDGHKGIFYIGLNPFTSRDLRSDRLHLTSVTGAAIYSRTVSRRFAYRVGISNSYTFGVLLPLPVAGVRFGALDKIHLSIQFPKNVSLDIPVGRKMMFSIFAKSMGGVYRVALKDSLVGAAGTKARLGRYELMSGGQVNVRIGNHLSFYIGTGISMRRRVNFTYHEDGKKRWQFVHRHIPASPFITFGLTVRLGQAKQVYNDGQMYNLFELNTLNGVGMKDTGTNDNDVPAAPQKYQKKGLDKVKYKDVEDLIMEEY